MIVIDNHSPESGWPPFVEWLRSNKIEPEDCRSVTVHDDGWLTVEMYAYDRDGRRPLDPLSEELCCYKRTARAIPAPPLHPDRQTVDA